MLVPGYVGISVSVSVPVRRLDWTETETDIHSEYQSQSLLLSFRFQGLILEYLLAHISDRDRPDYENNPLYYVGERALRSMSSRQQIIL
jgi:hypothetical protein